MLSEVNARHKVTQSKLEDSLTPVCLSRDFANTWEQCV